MHLDMLLYSFTCSDFHVKKIKLYICDNFVETLVIIYKCVKINTVF